MSILILSLLLFHVWNHWKLLLAEILPDKVVWLIIKVREGEEGKAMQIDSNGTTEHPSATKNPFQPIPREEMEAFPCKVEEIHIEVEDELEVVLYLVIPDKLKLGSPVVVNYHGGGFVRGRADRDELFCRRLATCLECVVVDVDYSLAPEHPFPTAVHQARAAALWAKAHAGDWGCDPEKIILCGQSAGGNLVANVCMEEAVDSAVKPLCAVIAYAPMNLAEDPGQKPCPVQDESVERARQHNSAYCSQEQAKDPRVSPLFAEESALMCFPPTLVITAGNDRLAQEGEVFAQRLIRAGATVLCKRYLDCPHGFLVNRRGAWREATELICTFLLQASEDNRGAVSKIL